MPPKEKGKKGKKKESPEKKKARLEMEALAAKEAEHSRVELARVKLREQRLREEALTAVNSRRVNVEWLQRMRALKLDELRREASALAREHDREVDRRDRLIEGLLDELSVADDQHDAAACAHLNVLEQLLELQGERMGALHARFTADLRSIQQEFESEHAEMVSLHMRQRKEAADVAAALEAAYGDAVQEAGSGYQLVYDEVKGRCTEEYNVLKLTLEQKLAGLEGQIEAQHQAYVAATRQQEAAHQELAKTDAQMTSTITAQTQRLRQLQETLAQWRGRIVHNGQEWERTNTALQREKESMIAHHSALKAALAKSRAAQAQRLKQMSASSAAVQASLRERLEAAGRILKTAELCRKFELPEDLTAALQTAGDASPAPGAASPAPDQQGSEAMPAMHSEPAADGGAQDGVVSPASPMRLRPDTGASTPGGSRSGSKLGACEAVGGVEDSCNGLESVMKPELAAFFQRLNKVYLDGAALGQQRLQLSTENAALRAVLRKVEEGTTVTQDVLDDPLNTLMVVNSRLQNTLKCSSAAKRGSAAGGC